MYEASIIQELAHLVDQTSQYSGNAVFTTALAYDEAYMNAQGAGVWPSAYYTKYSGYTNWQIFQAIYPNANSDILDYQFQTNAGFATKTDLQTVLTTYMPNTKGWVKNYVFLATPANAAVAKNGVLCVQQHTGYTTFPTSYWDCALPYNPDAADASIASAAHSLPFLSLLSNINIYALANVNDFNSFFSGNAPLIGTLGASITSKQVTGAFRTVYNGTNFVGVEGYMEGTVEHELAHQLDAIWGYPSGQAAYTSAIAADTTYLNTLSCTQIFTQAICNAYPTLTNWQIFTHYFPTTNSELWAYAFQHRAGAATLNQLQKIEQYLSKRSAKLNHSV